MQKEYLAILGKEFSR